VDNLVGQINGEFGTADWTPIIYIRRSVPRSELIALYALADVAWIAPLRDGFNLVAKEYVACNSDGILVLSEFAGAAAEMGEALFVNPYDEEATAETIAHALEIDPKERNQRMEALRRRVVRHNAFSWAEQFVENLEASAARRYKCRRDQSLELPEGEVISAFMNSSDRLFLLDYDGTLRPYSDLPQEAAPSPELLGLLEGLTRVRGVHVVLVSGRSRDDLERWFGKIERLWLSAEHGAIMRSPEAPGWVRLQPYVENSGREDVYSVLRHFTERAPGSFIEDKEFSLVWHYRMSDAVFGGWLAKELVDTLDRMLVNTSMSAVHGEKTVEVKFTLANKGDIYRRVSELYPAADFRLAAGDDVTDEDLFAQMPPSAWTVHVGNKSSRARFRLASTTEVLSLIRKVVEAGSTMHRFADGN
jgi:trehalose 6-phosphate synthase/phosphatase